MPITIVRNRPGKPVATVNDILIAALVLAVETWNETHGRDAGTIRITMPVNALATAGAEEPLGNLSRLTVIASMPAHRRSADELLTDITRQTAAAKLGQVGEPPDFGSGTPAVGMSFSPAVRTPAGLSLGVVTLNDRLNLCFRYRHDLLDPRTAARFAATFRAALDSLGDPRLATSS